ncbi:MAG: phosphotransferase [Lentisphaeria bacterium]|jgi:Ser/Thr protein kinase RdoA (MazF antagonist)|nr:phosphotransferase [Lentisphaeria bacterium]
MTEDQRIREALAAYDLGTVRAVHHHAGTAAKTWRVETDRGTWLLRTRGSRTSTDELIAFDHGLRAHLVRRGIPTAEPVPGRDGARFVRLDGQALEVYALLPGQSVGRAEPRQIAGAARLLAAFHRAGEDYRAAVPPVAQYRTLGLETATIRMESPELLSQVYAEIERQAGRRFPRARAVARDWLDRLRREWSDDAYFGLPQTMTHGDFTLANLLFAPDGEVCGVFDFDWSRRAPRVRDVADGLFFVSGRRRTPLQAGSIWSLTEAVRLSPERGAVWLAGYHAAYPLTAAEWDAIPLALAARWLSVRVEGMAKVAAADRLRFVFGNLIPPLRWLDAHWPELRAATASRLGQAALP